MIKNKAFTLMEMLIVLFIIGFILAFIGPRFYRTFFKTEVAVTKMKMSKIKNALLEYKQDMGHYPNKREGGIQALVIRPNVPGNEKWDGPYVDTEEDLEDKWGNPLELNIPPAKYKQFRFFEIISPGGESEDAKEIFVGA
ncbi:prepilin-type N-terminal cleavage/methylation domain-containing protein [Candidatus Dependentiae bacterium]|nr:prepilin-type N-terminal cleavage/methylation domain-containing protein [Candidatus Dependentiae bacterium]